MVSCLRTLADCLVKTSWTTAVQTICSHFSLFKCIFFFFSFQTGLETNWSLIKKVSNVNKWYYADFEWLKLNHDQSLNQIQLHEYFYISICKRYMRLLNSTCMVQVVFQPTFGALVVKLPPSRYKEQQVVSEQTTIHKWVTWEKLTQEDVWYYKWLNIICLNDDEWWL